jgi:cobaltochelatase CobN
VENTANLLRFLADTLLREGHGFEAPRALPELGVYVPGAATSRSSALPATTARPTVGVVFYRSHRVTGNTAFVDALARRSTRPAADALCVWAYSLRPAPTGACRTRALHGRIDALVTTVLASGVDRGGRRGDGHADWSTWRADALAALDVPVIQAVCATQPRRRGRRRRPA